MRAVAAIVLVLAARPAAAQDAVGLGDGHGGVLEVGPPAAILTARINRAERVLGALDAGTVAIPVASTAGFGPGDLLLIHQPGGMDPPDSGEVGPFDVSGTAAGLRELARVAAVDAGSLWLSAPLAQAFPRPPVQVVVIPELSSLTVHAGGSVVAPPWDGGAGGVVGAFVLGELHNDGVISASGAGFRGGSFQVMGSPGGCTALDLPFTQGAHKGEGLAGSGAAGGRGNIANGGGGADCLDSGGGGGGHSTRGGQGGWSWDGDGSRDVGGLGGAAVRYSLATRATFGGGGGAGFGEVSADLSGGAGGGLIFVRARALSGSGRLESNGARPPAPNILGDADGAGGGGAGGSIVVQLAGPADCALLDASGGDGAATDVEVNHGPGGGGGAGRILLQSSDAGTCPVRLISGAAGLPSPGSIDPAYGATSGTPADGQLDGLEFISTPFEDVGPPDAGLGFLAVGCDCSTGQALPATLIGLLALLTLARLRARVRHP